MKTTEKKIIITEMDSIEHLFLIGILAKLKEDSVVSVDKDELKMVDNLLEGLSIKKV